MRMGRMATYLVLGVLVAFAAYVRLAPSVPARWDVAPVAEGPWGEVLSDLNSASLRLGPEMGAPRQLLARLDAVALATPRTVRLVGSVNEGRVTWITRSRAWGFPDYTTAEARADGLYIQARSRFGSSDLGVNAARLKDWMQALSQG
jgi:uncharacterized protein (DUF1499 family)